MHGSQGQRERLRVTAPSENIDISKVRYFEQPSRLSRSQGPFVFFNHVQFVTIEAERV